MISEAKLTSGNTAARTAAEQTETAFKLVGFKNFIRKNPMSDKFAVKRFHHVEFWCSDATNTARRFSLGLGMPISEKSDLSTGNMIHASYLLRSGQLNLLFTAPYSPLISPNANTASIPTFSHSECRHFTSSHGLAVRAIAIEVEDAETAFSVSVAHGAKPSSPPVIRAIAIEVEDAETAFSVSVAHGAKPSSPPVILGHNNVALSEVKLYEDVILRFVSYTNPNIDSTFTFLPGFQPVVMTSLSQQLDYGIRGLDHAVGCVPNLALTVDYVKSFTGFHEFAEFTAEEVGTTESGLNSVVLACNNETVMIPMSEPVHGTKRKSQIQTYLEHNEGAGVQHLALASEDIFRTLREMRKHNGVGGFEFMPSPPVTYYRNLKNRVGDVLSDEQIKECEELGILVDRDDEGILLQIFTKPVGDRPTLFMEIIQRVGCVEKDDEGTESQKAGCGGFGRGNFKELFKSVEEYEKTLEA